ncbi:unnamed protein product [Ilex paraguariensis]|uniref:Late embryogenesis abundant protein n=1 Tax=Ilex paraguariensis TaxID=185542 RepID=A0ABC8V3A7_9AQUA
MAASLQSRRVASFGKGFVNQIQIQIRARSSRDAAQSPSLRMRRAVHVSVYDKNPDGDQVHPTVVPDEVIQPQSDKYWAPHPKTGIFGPVTEGGERSFPSSPASANDDSALEQQAFFRPMEDLEKPPPP